MTDKQQFTVSMTFEGSGKADDDVVITKCVIADDEASALNMALMLVKSENAEINCMKIWEWSIQGEYLRELC